jgi:NADH:ubiquinone oxidoreductase subunit 4 (subunit M)
MRAPILAALFMVVTLATLAMPGSANFIGEFYILNGVFQAKIVYAFVAAIGVALAAFYALRLYQRTMHNRLPDGVESRELSLREGAVLAPLVACIVALALWPGLILERGEASVGGSLQPVALAECVTNSSGFTLSSEPQPECLAEFGLAAREGISAEGGWTGYAPVSEIE